ncbi:hypothetical protein [Pleomorphovibrio marinus]|uniref:hypothetical protein n=1 Tax=Pleomorphovibrio marinus TaxID=2164132 RepID=UPI000E0C021E|nr:hypothetical protein [Pleomorphovibrio marinus]
MSGVSHNYCDIVGGNEDVQWYFAYSFLTATMAAVTVNTTLILAPILGPFIGLPGIGSVLGAIGLFPSSGILMGLLFNFVWVLVFSLCRMQVRFNEQDFSSLAGRHDPSQSKCVQGNLELSRRYGDEWYQFFPFYDGDYLYDIRTDNGSLVETTVGGFIITGNITSFVERTSGGEPATVRCAQDGAWTLHTEIDSMRKYAGHIAWILAALAILVLAIMFAPLLAPIEAICHAIPLVGPLLCAAVAVVIALVVSAVVGTLGGLVGDAIDAAMNPRDGVIEGTDEGWEPEAGQCVTAFGVHVTDLDHGWNELHPLHTLQQCTGKISQTLDSAGEYLVPNMTEKDIHLLQHAF